MLDVLHTIMQHFTDYRNQPILVSVDPGRKWGLALFAGRTLGFAVQHTGIVPVDELLQFFTAIRAANIDEFGRYTLVIEDQYLSFMNPLVYKVLVERRMEWTICARLAGWTIVTYTVAEWRKMLFGTATDIDKQSAICKAKALYGLDLDEDAAEATCIGLAHLALTTAR